MHDFVLGVRAAAEKVDLIADQNQKVFLERANLCFEVARAFILLAFVHHLVCVIRTESLDNLLLGFLSLCCKSCFRIISAFGWLSIKLRNFTLRTQRAKFHFLTVCVN